MHSYDTPTQLVVDKYMKEHGLEVEPDEEEFGFGKLLIDYKIPKNSTSKISNKGTELFVITNMNLSLTYQESLRTVYREVQFGCILVNSI